MSRLRSLLPYALSAYAWARKHPKAVLTAASILLLRVVAVFWTDVPADVILDALRVALAA